MEGHRVAATLSPGHSVLGFTSKKDKWGILPPKRLFPGVPGSKCLGQSTCSVKSEQKEA